MQKSMLEPPALMFQLPLRSMCSLHLLIQLTCYTKHPIDTYEAIHNACYIILHCYTLLGKVNHQGNPPQAGVTGMLIKGQSDWHYNIGEAHKQHAYKTFCSKLFRQLAGPRCCVPRKTAKEEGMI
eukprot:1143517-Pelagomonas_calceolata.AAC.7